MDLAIPDPSLVVLVGVAGSGKSTFAARRFRPHEVVSSDRCRELVAGDAADQAATGSAFSLLAILLDKRLKRRLLTVVDATNVSGRDRRRLTGQARRHGVPAVAIVLDLPLEECRRRNDRRPGRRVPADVLAAQHEQLRAGLPRLPDEGFSAFHLLSAPDLVDRVAVLRVPDGEDRQPGRRPPSPLAPAPRRPAVLVDIDSVDVVALRGLPALLSALTGRVDVVAVTARAADRDTLSERLDEGGVAVAALLVTDAGDPDGDRGTAAGRLLADEVLPGWRPLAGLTADAVVAERWRGHGLTVLGPEAPDSSRDPPASQQTTVD